MHGTGLTDQSARSLRRGRGVARDIARKFDTAFFDTDGVTTNGPGGIAAGRATAVEYALDGPTNYDAFAEAINEAEKLGYQLGAFAVDPTMALTLANSSKQHQPTCRCSVAMQPTFSAESSVSRSWSARTSRPARLGGVPKEVSFVVQRQGVELEVDRSVHFGSDPVAVRAIIPVGFAFPHPAGIVKLTEAAA